MNILETKLWVAAAVFAAAAGASACGGSDKTTDTTAVTRKEVIANYAEVVHRNYSDALDRARRLEGAIDNFLADRTPAKLEYAKRAWLEAREPYGQTEAFRFAGGPIDDEDGPEGRLNAWPLDEVYIDYVEGSTTAGIINDPSIEITKERIASLNEGAEGDVLGIGAGFEADKAVSSGYHAIEFLLWGQDNEDNGPGSRSYRDFLAPGDPQATAPNGDRRGTYLRAATALLIDDLQSVTDEWAPNASNYRATLIAGDETEALKNILASIGILSKGELAGERLDVALDTRDQEDEHSCFSDNTHVDVLMNATGIQNVYLGRYEQFDGPGIDELVRQVNPELDATMKQRLVDSIDAVRKIPAPFDQAIRTMGSESWNKVDLAVERLFQQGDEVVVLADALGLGMISVELPE